MEVLIGIGVLVLLLIAAMIYSFRKSGKDQLEIKIKDDNSPFKSLEKELVRQINMLRGDFDSEYFRNQTKEKNDFTPAQVWAVMFFFKRYLWDTIKPQVEKILEEKALELMNPIWDKPFLLVPDFSTRSMHLITKIVYCDDENKRFCEKYNLNPETRGVLTQFEKKILAKTTAFDRFQYSDCRTCHSKVWQAERDCGRGHDEHNPCHPYIVCEPFCDDNVYQFGPYDESKLESELAELEKRKVGA